jgi:hypothetical protein
MKIISNFKDFYDYLQGIYGIDPKVVYERICMTQNSYSKDAKWLKAGLYRPDCMTIGNHDKVEFAPIAICGRIYCVYIYNKKFYFGDNYEALEKLKSKIQKDNRSIYFDNLYYAKYHLKPTDINEKENCPVCLLSHSWSGFHASAKNVRLSDFGIGQIISPNDMYIMISNFISREKVIIDKRTDVEKLTSKGFDKKTSFRKM